MSDASMSEDSIWGDLDADEIPDDPNYVAPNTYFALLTEAKYITDKESGERVALTWKWVIQEPDSDYNGYSVTDYKQLPPSQARMAQEGREIDGRTGKYKLTPEEIRSMAFLKQQLIRTFDLSDEEVKRVSIGDLVGKSAYITTKEGSSKDPNDTRKFVNVSYSISPDKHAEQQAARGSSLAL